MHIHVSVLFANQTAVTSDIHQIKEGWYVVYVFSPTSVIVADTNPFTVARRQTS